MKLGVAIFPNSIGAKDVISALKELSDSSLVELWHKSSDLQNVDAIFIPSLIYDAGIFTSALWKSIEKFARNKGFVFGFGGGFRLLCAGGLLAGEIRDNESGMFYCGNAHIKGDSKKSPFTSRELVFPVASKQGCFFAEQHTLADLNNKEMVIFRFCDRDGIVAAECNPFGSCGSIAGVCNSTRNVYGMMFHPERAINEDLGNTDGKIVLKSIISIISDAN